MANFNIDDVLSQFGEKSSAPKKSGFDLDEVLSQFGDKTSYGGSVVEAGKPTKIIINTNPKPPISGISKEASDELNATREEKSGGENPRQMLPKTNVVESVVKNFNEGKRLAGQGLDEISSNKPASGVGNVALGALSALVSPATGLIEGGVTTPVTDVTGSERIGKTAGLIVETAMPIVPGANLVAKAMPKNKAMSQLVEHIGVEDLPSVIKAMKDNPRLVPADLSPRVLQDAQNLFVTEGKHIDHLANTSAQRMATRKDAMEEAYDASAGVAPDLAKRINDLAEASKKVGSEQINPLVLAAKPVNVSSTIDHINSILKPGVNAKISEGSTLSLPEVKQALAAAKSWLINGKETRTGAEDLHDIQKALRRQGYSLTKSANAGEREIGHALLNVRNSLVKNIDEASPGYAKALENYRDEMHIADAFKEGHDKIFSSSKKIENDPSFVRKWFDNLTDNEKTAAREGARSAIYTEMGVSKNGALAGESIARSDFNKAKMEILFGKDETEKLLNKLAVERAVANTHNKIVEGSQTAMRQASKQGRALPTPTEVMKSSPAVAAAEASSYFMGGVPGVGAGLLAAAKGAAMAKDAINMKLAKETNARYAKYAMPTEGPAREELIRALESYLPKPKQSVLVRGANTISRLVGP